jgi:hypothetical protein
MMYEPDAPTLLGRFALRTFADELEEVANGDPSRIENALVAANAFVCEQEES